MAEKKGFTLIEIITVMIIIGLLCAIGIPNYNAMVQQGAVTAAENNLSMIYGAQRNYYFTNGNYCITTSAQPCDSLSNINTALSLNLSDNYYAYSCTGNATTYTCTATNANLTTNAVGINNTINTGTLSCGELVLSKGLTGPGACYAVPSNCANGKTYAGQTYDCTSCCSS